MARKQKTPLAVDDNDVIYIKLKASGIHPLVAMCDGLPLALFGKGKRATAYIQVQTALAWHEKELKDSHGPCSSPTPGRETSANWKT
jgi:hypothetical protein